jgi:DNA-binding IclR family transcriptional regulator
LTVGKVETRNKMKLARSRSPGGRAVGRPRSNPKAVEGLQRLPGFVERQAIHLKSALGRGLMILRSFDVGDLHLGNAELATRTGLAKATVSRLTQLMTELGYLNYLPDLGKYEVAPGVLSLCHSYLGNMQVPAVARPAMLEFARDEQVNVGLGVQDGLQVIYVESALGEPMSGTRTQRVGYSVPVAFSVMGLTSIAGLPFERREALLQHIRSQATPREWRDISLRVEEATAEIHQKGFFVGIGVLVPRINMVGVPFYHAPSRTMLVFNCGGASPIQTPQKLRKLGPKLVRLANHVRQELDAMSAPYNMK